MKTLYTPIIKGKANDLKAIGRMPQNLALRACPLVELLTPDEPNEIAVACHRFGSQLRKYCPAQRVSVDLHAIPPNLAGPDGAPLLEHVFAYLKGIGISFVPVFGFDHEPELWDRVSCVAHQNGRGLTFRITREDLLFPDDTVDELIDRLDSSELDASQVNLLIDLGTLNGLDGADLAQARSESQDFIDLAMTARMFGLVSVVGSSMPKDVTAIPKEGHAGVARSELPLWLGVAQSLSETHVAFGDYGIVHPNFSAKTLATNANAKVRYTGPREHHIFRGYSLREGIGYKQYHQLSQRVREAPVYLGRDFSYGDDYVWRCAELQGSSGNLGTWVEVDMHHHLVFTATQLARIEARIASVMSMTEVEAIAE